jgi:hypothetical protein
MGAALNAFLDHWDGQKADVPFHAADHDALARHGLLGHFNERLAPYPFVGDLRSAKVWILMRNPSIGPNDDAQEKMAPLKPLLDRNLARRFDEYPFLHLNPALMPSDAYDWWNGRRGFSQLVSQFAERIGTDLSSARKLIAQRVAILELCPYRSLGFPKKATELPSSKLARAAAIEAVREAEMTGERGFVIPWDASPWRLPPSSFHTVIRNHRAQGFTFRMGARSAFGEHIWNYAFQPQ